MSDYAEHEIATFKDYAAFLNDGCHSENWLFRGQWQDWPLVPKLARRDLHLKHDVLDAERRMFEQFKLESPPHLPASVKTDWDLLVIAQHHGLPTRLLDWSTNPLAAMWFAVENPAVDGKAAVVWAFDFDDELVIDREETRNPFSVDRSRILRPSHIARRLVAQLGWFTVHAHWPDHGGFVPMEKSVVAHRLTKITVPPNAFCDMRYHLDRCGINRSCLYPDLDGLCRRIQWKHARLGDEETS